MGAEAVKAFKSDGSRWFARTASEVMAAWLEQNDLRRWLECTIEFRAQAKVFEVLDSGDPHPERYARALLADLGCFVPKLEAVVREVLDSQPSVYAARLERLRGKLSELKAQASIDARMPRNRAERRALGKRFRGRH